MNRRVLAAIACTAATPALSAPSVARTSFSPTLSTSTQEMSTSFNTSVSFEINVARDDDALFRGDVYVPHGYVLEPSSLPIGIVRGVATARLDVREPAGEAIVDAFGSIVVENPASFATNPCAAGLHAGVWTIHFDIRGRDLPLQLYVDQTTGADTALGAYRIRLCLPAPDETVAVSGSTFNAKLLRLQVNFRGHFTAPTSPGAYTWRLLATPWQTEETPNVPGGVEARSEILLPAQLKLRATVKGRTVAVRGTLTELSQPVTGQIVSVRVGERLHQVRTRSAGAYALNVQLRSRTRAVVWATATVRTRDLGGCPPPSPAPAGCVSMTRAYYTIGSRFVRVRVP
jgi:hypothetical protein